MPQQFTERTQYVYRESGTRTSDPAFTGDTVFMGPHLGVKFTIDISAQDTISATYTIQYKDPIGGDWNTLLASAAKTGAGAFTLTVGPGVTTASNVALRDYCPAQIRLICAGTATSITDSVYIEKFYV
jgi:hypothetical protein